MKELLVGKNITEKTSLKSDEIIRVSEKKKFVRSEYDIDVIDIEKIEGGVQVFVRAYKDGQQLGFGEDGSVDIERFRIFNPPILVPDENGEVVVVTEANKEFGTKRSERRFHEDPLEAVIQVIEHNLSIMKNVHLGKNIVKNKIGNTTSTFFPTLDGWVISGQDSNWATHRTQGTATGSNAAANDTGATAEIRAWLLTNYYGIRAFFTFNTAAIDDADVISSAIFSGYCLYANSPGNGLVLVPASHGASITTADWGSCTLTALSNVVPTLTGSGENGYKDFTLNDLTKVIKTGNTELAVMSNNYVSNTPHTGTTDVTNLAMSETSGTSQDPKLVVEHAAAGGGVNSNFLQFM